METGIDLPTVPADLFKELLQSENVAAVVQSDLKSLDDASAEVSLGTSETLCSQAAYEESLAKAIEDLRSTKICKDITEILTSAHSEELALISTSSTTKHNSTTPTLLGLLHQDIELVPLLQEIDQLGALAFVTFWQKPDGAVDINEELAAAAALQSFSSQEDDEDEEELTLHAAALEGDRQLLTDLLHEGADVNEVDEEGRTAMHNASGFGELGCILILLSMGGDVNAVDNFQNSPLHYAAGYGEVDAVKVLLKNGADPTLKNIDGHTPLQLAKINKSYDVVDILDRSLVRE